MYYNSLRFTLDAVLYYKYANTEATQNRDFCTNAYGRTQFWLWFFKTGSTSGENVCHNRFRVLIFSLNWTRLIGRARCTEVIYVDNLSDSQRTMTCSQMLILSLLRLPPLEREGKKEEGLTLMNHSFLIRGCLTLIRAANFDLWRNYQACFFVSNIAVF